MDQNRMKVWLLAALLAVGAMVPFVLQRGNINRLQAENARLQTQVQELTATLEKSATNAAATASRQESGASKEQLLELMRLRAEVTALRKLTNAAAGALQRPASALAARGPEPAVAGVAAPPVLTTNGPPWNFKGYARPEDTVSTVVWAMEQGRLDLLLNSATPEAQVTLQQEYGPSSNPTEQLQRQARDIVEVRPSQNYPPTENEVYMSMVINRPEQQLIAEQKMDIGGRTVEKGQPYTIGAQSSETVVKLQRVGNDWKFGGRIGK